MQFMANTRSTKKENIKIGEKRRKEKSKKETHIYQAIRGVGVASARVGGSHIHTHDWQPKKNKSAKFKETKPKGTKERSNRIRIWGNTQKRERNKCITPATKNKKG